MYYPTRIDWILELPIEMWVSLILMRLCNAHNRDIFTMRTTCKKMAELCTLDIFWLDYNMHNAPKVKVIVRGVSVHKGNTIYCDARKNCTNAIHYDKLKLVPRPKFKINIFWNLVNATLPKKNATIKKRIAKVSGFIEKCEKRIKTELEKIEKYKQETRENNRKAKSIEIALKSH